LVLIESAKLQRKIKNLEFIVCKTISGKNRDNAVGNQ
jgi:hypothetical protein